MNISGKTEIDRSSTKYDRISIKMIRSSDLASTFEHRSSVWGQAVCAPRHRSSQSGFSLLEALVTLLILSIGLMGLALLQAQGMHLNTSAYTRTQASILAGDIIDRMRLNAANAASYDTSSFSPTPSSCSDTSAPSADNDRNCWYQLLRTSLPGGNGGIAVNSGIVTITVSWVERPGATRGKDFDPSTLTSADLIQQMSMKVAL